MGLAPVLCQGVRNTILAICLMLTAPALAQSEADWVALDACDVKRVTEYDDLVSDALTIARVMRFHCFDAEMALAKTHSAYKRLAFAMSMRSTSVVLLLRSADRANQVKQP